MKQLESQNKGAVVVEIENATANQAMITQEYGFKTHGLVFFDGDKTTVLKTMDGHLMKNDEIERALGEVLASVRDGAGTTGS